jgi:hypothetical protein
MHGFMPYPYSIIDCLLTNYTHLEPSMLAEVIYVCLVRCIGNDLDLMEQHPGDEPQSSTSLKRTIDDVGEEAEELTWYYPYQIENYVMSILPNRSILIYPPNN